MYQTPPPLHHAHTMQHVPTRHNQPSPMPNMNTHQPQSMQASHTMGSSHQPPHHHHQYSYSTQTTPYTAHTHMPATHQPQQYAADDATIRGSVHGAATMPPAISSYNELVSTYQQTAQQQHQQQQKPQPVYSITLQPSNLYNYNNKNTHDSHQSPSPQPPITHSTALMTTPTAVAPPTAPSTPLLYHKQIPVHIHSSNRESQCEMLTVKLSYVNATVHPTQQPTNNNFNGTNNNTSAAVTRCLHVEVTAEHNPYMLYTSTINEYQFSALKRDQQLLVDFNALPMSIAQMLNTCVQNDSNYEQHAALYLHAAADSSTPASATFKIVKNIDFRHVDFLALALQQGTDEHLKAYLIERLNEYKSLSFNAQTQCSQLSETVNRQQSEISTLQSAAQKHDLRLNESVQELKQQHLQEMQATTQRHSSELKLQSEQHHQSMSNVEQTLKSETSKLSAAVAELQQKNSDLLEQRHQLQTKLTTLQLHSDSLQQQLNHALAELQLLRDKHHTVDSQLYDTTHTQHQQQLKIVTLEQSCKEKEGFISQLQQQVSEHSAIRMQLDESLKLYKEQLQQTTEKLEFACSEIHSGNEYINKLQQKSKALKAKLENYRSVIEEQEQQLNQQQSTLTDRDHTIQSLQRDASDLQASIEREQKQAATLQQQCADHQQQLDKDKQIIDYLNTELNQSKHGGGSHFRTFSSPLNPVHASTLGAKPFVTLGGSSQMLNNDTKNPASGSLLTLRSPPASINTASLSRHISPTMDNSAPVHRPNTGSMSVPNTARSFSTGASTLQLQSQALFTQLPSAAASNQSLPASKQSSYFNSTATSNAKPLSSTSNRNSVNDLQQHLQQMNMNVAG